MRKLHVLGVTVFAVFALSAIAASSAFALESVWLVSGAKPTTEEAVLSENTTVLLLEDMGTGVDVTCPVGTVLNEGTVGPMVAGESAKFDLTTKVTFPTTCTSTSGTVLKVTAVHLPWLTELFLSGTLFLDRVTSSGAGAPGYEIEIDILGITVKDTCTTEKSTTEVENNALSSDVDVLFLETAAESEFANCTAGGNLKGLVVGTILIKSATAGLALAVSEA